MGHKQLKVSALHHLHCWGSPDNWSFKLWVLNLLWVKIPSTKGQVSQKLRQGARGWLK